MEKALIFTDLHLHAHKDRVDRLQHCIDVLNWVFRTAKERKCRYIFFLGDLFHERDKIDVMNYLRTFEVFIKHMIEEPFPLDVFLLVGNHDMYHKEKWEVNSVKPLSAIPNVHLIDRPTRTHVESGRTIDWMPHTDNPVKELKKLRDEQGGCGDILLGHMAVHGATLNTFYGTKADVIVEYDNDMVPVDVSVFDGWKQVYLGHYHGAQQLSPTVEYVGSPLQLTFGESFQQKHILLLDLETLEKEYIVNEFSPRHLIITPQDITDENYDFNNTFVRLSVDDLACKDLIEMKRGMAQKYKLLSLDTKQKERKVEEDKVAIDESKIRLADMNNVMGEWVKEKGIPEGMDREKLLAWGKRCLGGSL